MLISLRVHMGCSIILSIELVLCNFLLPLLMLRWVIFVYTYKINFGLKWFYYSIILFHFSFCYFISCYNDCGGTGLARYEPTNSLWKTTNCTFSALCEITGQTRQVLSVLMNWILGIIPSSGVSCIVLHYRLIYSSQLRPMCSSTL